jgi:ABC-type lipoprotein export system ATPase subunit
MDIFTEINDKGHTIVMITHEPDIATHAKRVITMKDGKIVGGHNNPKKIKFVHSH